MKEDKEIKKYLEEKREKLQIYKFFLFVTAALLGVAGFVWLVQNWLSL